MNTLLTILLKSMNSFLYINLAVCDQHSLCFLILLLWSPVDPTKANFMVLPLVFTLFYSDQQTLYYWFVGL